jgi:hypothetical protein
VKPKESIYKAIQIVWYRQKLANIGRKKEKIFIKLGQLYYNLLKKTYENPLLHPSVKEYINRIIYLNEEIEKLQKELNELDRSFPALKTPIIVKGHKSEPKDLE